MYLIVGLGNPGNEYKNTYHNMGFMACDVLMDNLEIASQKKECESITYHTNINGEKVIIAKPQTFMNLSGKAVLSLKTKYKIDNCNILVICDDIDLAVGAVRFRENGSGGTHNGMRNIVSTIGTDFKRIRIGIGRSEGDLADYVLSKISKEHYDILQNSFEEVTEKIFEIIKK